MAKNEENEKKVIILEPMTVEVLAKKLQKPVEAIILFLLKQGVVAAKNKVLPSDVIKKVAVEYEFEIEIPAEDETIEMPSTTADVVEGELVERLPIIVVVGHVDHGKTTLLDFIRKTKITAGEKGGITQHIGAYKAHTPHGDLVFIDTPGHATFSLMRARSISVADIAIIVIAGDDGIMPQTVEAIKYARATEMPIIIAINKIDKASDKQIENLKGQLANHDLLPEEWGGQTICVKISALKGSGVNELLEMIVLQASLMELKASVLVPAVGYILESKIEKGLGAVATVICQHGILKIGDYFSAGSTWGKVSSMKDWSGKTITSAEPSLPVQVAGFRNLPKAGTEFRVGEQSQVKRDSKEKKLLEEETYQISGAAGEGEKVINLILKADTTSSIEALFASIGKMSKKLPVPVRVLSAKVGSITERDILTASDTDSILYGLHTKIEQNAVSLSKKIKSDIRLFDIIYKLLEDLEELAQKFAPIEIRLEKIGEALVLKVFDIKKVGTIAGARILDGYCSKDSTVLVKRGSKKVGEGKIISLQKEKSLVKEVKKGFECAFIVDGFTDWNIDDRVECYLNLEQSSVKEPRKS